MIRKLPVFLLFLLFLCFPFYVSAEEIGINMALDYSTPNGWVQFPNSSTYGYYVLDYDAYIDGNAYEVFCVEYSQEGPTEGSLTEYTLSTISGDDLIQAALYADFFYLYYDGKDFEDYYKAAAQIIIWETLFEKEDYFNLASGSVRSISYGDYISAFLKAYNKYASELGISSSNWVVATNYRYQNYLIRYTVPEPTQMLLFGTGLIALAGIGRKRFLKK